MAWPTISKGVFYPGYNKGKSEGPKGADRPTGPKYKPAKGSASLYVVQASKGMTQAKHQYPVGK